LSAGRLKPLCPPFRDLQSAIRNFCRPIVPQSAIRDPQFLPAYRYAIRNPRSAISAGLSFRDPQSAIRNFCAIRIFCHWNRYQNLGTRSDLGLTFKREPGVATVNGL
jgi:hypothetical protein